MSKTKTSKSNATPPTVITLTLPESSVDGRSGTLLIQRGDLAHVCQFAYTHLSDLTGLIKEAVLTLAAVEADPPIIPDSPVPSLGAKQAARSEPPEPTVDIPLKKGTKAIKISHLKIDGGESDAAAYRQAVLLAGKFIDGKLWDGESPIRFDDVYAAAKKMKHLTDRDLSLFTLQHFVKVGAAALSNEPDELTSVDKDSDVNDEPLRIEPPAMIPVSANGRHRERGASSQMTVL